MSLRLPAVTYKELKTKDEYETAYLCKYRQYKKFRKVYYMVSVTLYACERPLLLKKDYFDQNVCEIQTTICGTCVHHNTVERYA